MKTNAYMADRAASGHAPWHLVEGALVSAAGIAWDGCHKIYVLTDPEEVGRTRSYGYGEKDTHLTVRGLRTTEELLNTVRNWFDDSCGMRFVSASGTKDGQHEITTLIAQFEEAF